MRLPNSSNAYYVAFVRYVQSIHETGEFRNPDTFVSAFVPWLQRWKVGRLGQASLDKLRSDPFYFYVIARTRHYDQVFEAAIADGVRQIIGIGTGSDSRAYRYRDALTAGGVRVLDCDQADAVKVKRRIVQRWPAASYVDYMAIDLNAQAWPELEGRIVRNGPKTLLWLEGVSPYVDQENFTAFLRMVGKRLPPGSQVAYDYKLQGVQPEFGRTNPARATFRMPAAATEVAAFHEKLGLRTVSSELSNELTLRLLPALRSRGTPLFLEDGLARLTVAQ